MNKKLTKNPNGRERSFSLKRILFLLLGTVIILKIVVILKNESSEQDLLRRITEMEQGHPRTAIMPSSFVNLESIPKNERTFTPGPYAYSNSETLIITGATVSGDYHHSNSLWIQLFAIGEKTLQSECAFTNETWKELYRWKPWELMIKENFLCKIGNATKSLRLVPQEGVDPNTLRVIQIWRANITSLLSGHDFQRLRHRQGKGASLALPIEILHMDQVASSLKDATKVTKLYFPIDEPSLGLNEIKSKPPPKSIMQQRYDITLCGLVHPNGLKHITEWLRYHYDIVGIDHIHLGIDQLKGNNAVQSQLVSTANRLFKHEIEDGRLTISSVWDDSLGIQCNQYEPAQLQFYQNCLYRAKSTSEFMAVWDPDEFFLMKNERLRKQKVANLLRNISHPECQDWSFVTMKSSTAGGNLPLVGRTGLAALDYPMRENSTNRLWQKSISRTKNVFSNSIHIPSSLLPQGSHKLDDVVSMHPKHNECAFYYNDALMIHTRGVQEGWGDIRLKDPIPNELSSL